MKVLLVDDDNDDLQAFASAIEFLKLPIQLLYAKDSRELDEFLEKEKDINLILLDINMPLKDGLQCLREIKASDHYKHIPVIIFTVSVRQKDIDTAFENYAHYYVVKPYARVNFYQTINKIFSLDWTKDQPIPPKDDFVINLAYLKF
jgi:CheY-like chemotaxis protein